MMGDYKQARQHLAAAEYMIDMKGGYQTLGLNGFLAQLATCFGEELLHAGASKEKSKDSKTDLSLDPCAMPL